MRADDSCRPFTGASGQFEFVMHMMSRTRLAECVAPIRTSLSMQLNMQRAVDM